MKKQLTELFNKYKTLFIPIIIGVSSLILILLVIYPQLTVFLKGQKDLQTVEQRLKKLQVKAQDLESLDEDDLNKKLEYALAALPVEKDYATIIGVFQRISAQSNMSLETLRVGGLGSGGDKKTPGYSVQLELLGTKSSLNGVLQQIEKAPRVMKVNGIELTASKSNVNVTLAVDVFYLPAPTSIGSVDAVLPKLTDEEQKLLTRLASISPSSISTTPTTLLPRGKPDPFQ